MEKMKAGLHVATWRERRMKVSKSEVSPSHKYVLLAKKNM